MNENLKKLLWSFGLGLVVVSLIKGEKPIKKTIKTIEKPIKKTIKTIEKPIKKILVTDSKAKHKVGDTVRIDNKSSDFHNKKRTFTDKDIKAEAGRKGGIATSKLGAHKGHNTTKGLRQDQNLKSKEVHEKHYRAVRNYKNFEW